MKVVLIRLEDDGIQTLGNLFIFKGINKIYECKTLELPWKDNQRNISCIPTGVYTAIKHSSPKFGNSLWLQNVPGRSEILIHYGNYNRNTNGCILPGKTFLDIDGDGSKDVTSSIVTIKELWSLLPNEFEIEIL